MKPSILSLFGLLTAVIVACTSGATPTATPEPTKSVSSTTSDPAWKGEWDSTLAAAKKEGKATIYTSSGPSQTDALRQGFERAYGLDLEFVSGRGGELREKLFRERRAGLYLADLFLMGASGMVLDLKPVGILDPMKPQLVLPEVMDLSKWYGGDHIYMDKERTYVLAFTYLPYADIAINTELVQPGEIKSYKDLLNPKWRGKIVINDPTTTGPGQAWFAMVAMSLGLDYMRQLARQEPAIVRDLRQQTEWVARGKYAVLIGVQHAAVAEFLAAGAPLKYVLSTDSGYAGAGTGSMGLINRAAHPNAVKVFINWLLTREGQTIYSKAFLIQSARLDVPTDHLDPVTLRQPGVTYLNSGDEAIELNKNVTAREAGGIFGITSK